MLSPDILKLVEDAANRYPRTSEPARFDKDLEFLEECGPAPGTRPRVKIEIELPAVCTYTITIKAE